jgi:phasin
MTDQFTRQAQEIFAAAKEARIPDNVQAIVENSVAKTREAYSTMNSAAKDGVKVLEDVMVAAHAGAKTIGEKILRNTEANAEAAFDVARAISRAGTLPEVVRLQTSFLQNQFAVASAQTKELLELSAKVAQQTFETMNSAATRTFEQIRKAR